MVLVYMQAPTLLGIGRMTVKLELPRTGGLYQFSNVTYRGVQIGKVTEVRPTRAGAEATLSLDTSPKIPADLQASVLSVSAVGEQYVDLQPRTDSGPYLKDGAVIPAKDTTVPQAVGPMLDQVSALLQSIPKQRLSDLLNDAFKGFNGAGDDLTTLLDSSSKLVGDFNSVGGSDPNPGRRQQTDCSTGRWSPPTRSAPGPRSLAGITGQVATDDPQLRGLLANGPGAADEASQLLNEVKPTLPVLLANLTTVGQVAVTYHASLEQLLVLLPPYVGSIQAVGSPLNNPTGMTLGDFTLTIVDPPACTVGFLPPSSWRSPADLSDIDTPDGLYCKLPQDSPIAVRGARNYPCMGQPGKRAPTVEICESRPALRAAGHAPARARGLLRSIPNLIAQGIPPDDRTTLDEHIYGPLDGTPRPPGPAPGAAPAPPAEPAPVPAANGAPAVAPSASRPGTAGGPSVAIATYDPKTGQYAARRRGCVPAVELGAPEGERSWKDLLPTT